MKRNIRIWFRRMFFVFVVMLWLETGGHQTVKAYGDSGEGLKDKKTVETQPSDTDELSLDETETTEELSSLCRPAGSLTRIFRNLAKGFFPSIPVTSPSTIS